MAGIDREGREYGIDVLVEVLGEERLGLVVEVVVTHDDDAAGREFGQDRVDHEAILSLDEFEHAFADRRQLLTRSDPVDGRRLHPSRDLVFETHHPHLKELVDHLGEDGHELAPLENG